MVRRAGVSPRRAEEALENAAKLEALEFVGHCRGLELRGSGVQSLGVSESRA